MARDIAHQASTHTETIRLREYVDMRFDAQEKAVGAALASADRAVSKAEASTERRMEGMNEFRSALGDYARTLMPRSEAETMIRDLREKIEDLSVRVNAIQNRGHGRGDMWGYVVGGIAVLIALIVLIVKGVG